MGLEQAVREIKEKKERETFTEILKDLHEEYGIDQRELGKIIIISSLTLLVVSIPSAISLQNAHSEMEQINDRFDRLQGVIQDDSFQQSLDTLSSEVSGFGISEQIEQVDSTFDEVSGNIDNLEDTEEKMQKRADTYKWLSLGGIIGLVSGLAIMFV